MTGPRETASAAPSVAAVLTIAFALLQGCSSSPPVRETHPSVHRAPGISRSRSSGNQPARGEIYVVSKGDTLYSIAFRNQLDYHELADWNGIGRDYAIRVGQSLRLTSPDDREARAAIAEDTGARPDVSSRTRAAGSPVVSASRASTGPSRPSGGDAWEWPTRNGKILRAFDDGGNKGVDIGGEPGQIVVASRAGKVVYSGSALKGYGELVIIKHDEEYLSAYGYNRRRLVEEGDSVVGGQPIAELGVGPEQKPLLHFEIRDHGKPIDPNPLLPPR